MKVMMGEGKGYDKATQSIEMAAAIVTGDMVVGLKNRIEKLDDRFKK